MPDPIVDAVSSAPDRGEDKTLPILRRETEAYLDTVRELERKRKPGEGIFGLKGGPADNPCHERYDQTVQQLLKDFAARNPASETVREVLEELYSSPKKYSAPTCAYWMLIAVQRHSVPLIDLLSSEDAFALYVRFNKDIPRRERLPVQTEILKKLKQK